MCHPLSTANAPLTLLAPVAQRRQAVVLALAMCALLLGLVPLRPSQLLEVGRPVPQAALAR